MSIETIRRVTTIDGTTYNLAHAVAPQVWAVAVSVSSAPINENADSQFTGPPDRIVHVTRQMLVDVGLVVRMETDAPFPDVPETEEDLIVRILAHIAVHPET